MSLDTLLFKHDRDVDAAISYLKEKKLGWANFYALNILHKKPVKIPKPPMNSKLLLELITLKSPDYKVALESALRDTLVCETYDEASEVNSLDDGYRVVTLDGTVFEKN